MQLLLASNNRKKLGELQALLAPLEIQVLIPADIGGLDDVDEDRPDFAGNAFKKASAAARTSGRWALGDDSGLEVAALNGAPGVRSARFAGPAKSDAANNHKLIELLAEVPDERRDARFVCALSLARPDGTEVAALEGEARGRILREARGTGGFGYDPLFLFTEPGFGATGKTFAELTTEEKSQVSHRGRALAALAAKLPHLLRT